jgi:hypothetical protein
MSNAARAQTEAKSHMRNASRAQTEAKSYDLNSFLIEVICHFTHS